MRVADDGAVLEIVVVTDPPTIEAIERVETRTSPVFIRESYEQLSFSEEELGQKKVGLLATMFPPSWGTPDTKLDHVEGVRRPLREIVQGSPTLLIVVYDPSKRAPASEGDQLGMMGLGCVMENMWLVAEEAGIGFQIMSVFGGDVEGEVKSLLAIPHDRKVAFAVRLGYPLAPPGRHLRVRRDVADVAHRNQYGRRG